MTSLSPPAELRSTRAGFTAAQPHLPHSSTVVCGFAVGQHMPSRLHEVAKSEGWAQRTPWVIGSGPGCCRIGPH